MSEGEAPAEAPAQEQAPLPEQFSSPSEAARVLSALAHAKRKEAAAAPAQQAPEQPTDPIEEAPVEVAPAEEQPEVEAHEPPIDAPVSWPKEEKDAFAQLPRSLQETIARREQERERHFSRGQNETAEQRKALEAKAQDAERLRQEYEQRLPLIAQAIQHAMTSEFPDIKTMDDVQRLAREDWPRYVQWDAKQKQLSQWQSEAVAAHQRQTQEAGAKLESWRASEDAEFEKSMASVPETERKAIATEAKNALLDYGLTEAQISELWNSSILRSAAAQRMLADAARYRIAKRNAAKPAAKPIPPVQKPGNAMKAPNRALESQIATLEAQPSLSLKEATLLMDLKGQRRKSAA